MTVKGVITMAEKKYMTVDAEKKVITLDMSIKPTAFDDAMLEKYMLLGFKVREKSAKRAERMKNRAATMPTDDEILEALKDDAAKLKRYKDIKTGKQLHKGKKGFFSARSWYQNGCKDE